MPENLVGKRLAHYEIRESLGAGGMGEVYRAHDTKLDREIAIKVLPVSLASRPDRLSRFEREAKSVASLKHPNIVTIHSVEDIEGIHFLTMELVEGQTLSEILGRNGLPLKRFFDLAVPLADALAAAHARGITHRDIKPSNIMVTDEGRLKVLDFGIAKLRQEEPGTEATRPFSRTISLDSSSTGLGVVLGTAPYMSPEQAQGKQVDHRSDIFSLGIVLYEMATGARPFSGDTDASIISSILRDTPTSVTELNRQLPRHLGRVVARCLAKEPERRYQTAVDVRNELDDLKREIDSGEREGEGIPALPRSRWRSFGVPAVGLLVATLVVLVVIRSINPTSMSPPRVALSQVTDRPDWEGEPSISPDGRAVVYTGQVGESSDIYLLRIGGGNAINLTEDCPYIDTEPAFSPDGSQIAFRSEREGGGLFMMGATGESPRRITDFGHYPSWSPDGSQLVFSLEHVPGARSGPNYSQIWRVDLSTGQTRLILDDTASHPVFSPRGHRIAYWAQHGGQRDIWTIRPDGTDPQAVTRDEATDWRPVWAPGGDYLYFVSDRGGTDNIWRIPVDERSGRSRGIPEPITSGTSQIGMFSLSEGGERIACTVGVSESRLERFVFNSERAEVVEGPELVTTRTTAVPEVSPDGKWITYMSFGGQEDIYVMRFDGSGVRQLTNDAFRDRKPTWSPNGDRIAFTSNRSGKYEIWTISTDGSGLRQETDYPERDLVAPDWSPDGSWIACTGWNGINLLLDMTSEPDGPRTGEAMEVLPPFNEEGMLFVAWCWSPDGRRLGGEVAMPDGTPRGMASYSLDSKEYEHLFTLEENPGPFFTFDWLPDGRRLLCSTPTDVFLVDTRTRRRREIRVEEGKSSELGMFVLSPGGRTLLRVSGSTKWDIWLVELGARS